MNFDLDEEQAEIRDMVRGFTEQHITPYAETWDEHNHFHPRQGNGNSTVLAAKALHPEAFYAFGGLDHAASRDPSKCVTKSFSGALRTCTGSFTTSVCGCTCSSRCVAVM